MSRLVLALVVLAAAVTAASAGAAAARELRLTELRAADFPNRSYALRLPGDAQIDPRTVQVRENGQPVADLAVVPATALGRNERALALLIDASESMKGDAVENATVAARAFAARRRSEQEMAVLSFNETTNVLVPFTLDQGAIDRALERAPAVRYWTKLYDAIRVLAAEVQQRGYESTSVVLLSDGQELGSEATLVDATVDARAANVRIFVVGLRSRFFDDSALRRLAAETGGQYLEATSPRALPAIFDALGSQLANEHLIQYRSLAGPAERIEVTVTVRGVDGVAVAGYVSPELPTAAPAPPVSRSALDGVVRSNATMFLFVVLTSGLLGLATVLVFRPITESVRTRLAAFVSVSAHEGTTKRRSQALEAKLNAGTEKSLERSRWWTRFKADVALADIRFAPMRIVIWTATATILAAWLLPIAVNSRAGAVLALAIPVVVRAAIKRRISRKRRLFADQLPDNLDVLASALRAGHSFVGALSVVVDDCIEPSRTEFRRVIAEEQLGASLEDALDVAAKRMASAELEQIALVAALQRQTGANSAEVLDRVTENVRERAAVRRLVRTLTSQGRLSGWVVALLPVGLLGAMTLLNYQYVSPMFLEPVGRVLLLVAAVMTTLGFIAIRRVVNIKV
jgi:tight adherence protein B